MAPPDSDSWEARAERAAVDVEAKRQMLEAAVELRDQVLIDGIDAGRGHGDVARALHLSKARLHQILAAKG